MTKSLVIWSNVKLNLLPDPELLKIVPSSNTRNILNKHKRLWLVCVFFFHALLAMLPPPPFLRATSLFYDLGFVAVYVFSR